MWKLTIVAFAAACSSSSSTTPSVSSKSGAPSTASKTVSDLSPRELRDRINGVNAHVVVTKTAASFAEYRDVLAKVEQTPGVLAAEPMVMAEVLAGTDGSKAVGIAIKGVDVKRVRNVLDLASQITTGSIDDLGTHENGIILGNVLATELGAKVGDHITLTVPLSDASGSATPRPPRTFEVRGVFHVDFDEYDRRLAVANLAAVQELLGNGDVVMAVEARVRDVDHADQVARAIEKALGGAPYRVMDWYELNKAVFSAKP